MIIYNKLLYLSRKVWCKLFPDKSFSGIITDLTQTDSTSDLIYNRIMSGKPLMVTRYGSTELTTIVNYLGVKKNHHNPFSYIFRDGLQWWWNTSLIAQMQNWSGFFPPTTEKVSQFCQLVLDESYFIDILGCWTFGEKKMIPYIGNAKYVHLRTLEPFWSSQPWTRALRGKKVLVVHPFAETIKAQYARRELLFDTPDILPEFTSLHVIKAVQSLGKGDSRFSDWFEALKWMEDEIDKHDYDICLIGCGAYGLPLAAHVKRCGKQAIHLGGVLQLLFGIRGKRWDNPMYGVKEWGLEPNSYTKLINRYWIHPAIEEKPANASSVENGCYW